MPEKLGNSNKPFEDGNLTEFVYEPFWQHPFRGYFGNSPLCALAAPSGVLQRVRGVAKRIRMLTTQTPEYRRAYAVAKAIKARKNKIPAILFLCKCLREMLKVA